MNPFRLHRRALRHTVRWTLLVWLFALGASVANACLFTPGGSGGLPAALVSQPAAHGHGEDAPPAHHAPGDDGLLGCLKFCDGGASLLVQTGPQAPDLDHPLVTALAPPGGSLAAPGAPPGLWRSTHRPAPTGPPIAIRLLRLTR